jgi:hypothetical protein
MRAGIFATAIVITAATALPASAATVRNWNWLNGTTWIVPTSGLPAYVYDPEANSLEPVQDQTVYTITGYRNGYFWGSTATKIGSGNVTCKTLVGSVTPEGKVYLTFTAQPYIPNVSGTTVGIGNMVVKGGQWTMANQMSTGSSSEQVGHWAYMVQTKPGMSSWYSLPGVNEPAPVFIARCADAAPSIPSPPPP